MPAIEPASTEFEPSLWHQNTDIEGWRPETGARNWARAEKIADVWVTETWGRRANARECRHYLFGSDIAGRDRTAWLRTQSDANRSQMPNSLITGKIQGISRILTSLFDRKRPVAQHLLMLAAEFPMHGNRELKSTNKELR